MDPLDPPPKQPLRARLAPPAHLEPLLSLRWGTALAHLIVLVGVRWGLGLVIPLPPALALMTFDVLVNLALTAWTRRARSLPEHIWAVVIALDILLLSLLLHVTGGPYNPFSLLYLLHLAIASVALSTRWATAHTALALIAYGALFFTADDHSHHHHHHGGAALRLHLEGMWYAFAVTAAFMVAFIHQLRAQLAQQDARLAHEAALRQRQTRLASLATLAAGAAHELSTPLSTIALVARELELELGRHAADPALAQDARLIRDQVTRCHTILEQLGQDAGAPAGEPVAQTLLASLIQAAASGAKLPVADALTTSLADPLAHTPVLVPPRALRRALRGLIQNAADAAHERGLPLSLSLAATHDGQRLTLALTDRSGGLPADAAERVGEPFFTTKPTGQGMGLGVFLARSLCEQHGGSLTLTNHPGVGLTAVMTLDAPLQQEDDDDDDVDRR
jgi:two-component system sensor histidine kinase RegB